MPIIFDHWPPSTQGQEAEKENPCERAPEKIRNHAKIAKERALSRREIKS
jgi:hypothetical protein